MLIQYYLNSYDEDRINKIITAFKYVNNLYDYHIYSTIIHYKLVARFIACQPGLKESMYETLPLLSSLIMYSN